MLAQTDLIVMLLFLLIAAFTRIKKDSDINVFLSTQNSLIIKGLMAIVVVLCHISFLYESNLLKPFEFISNIAVGTFFFLSGYGLMKQFSKRLDYHVGFFSGRSRKVLLPYMLVTIMYWLFYYINGEKLTIINVFDRIIHWDPIVSYSWYIIEILLLYMFFYLFMLISKGNKKRLLFLNVVLYLSFLALTVVCDFKPFVYHSTHMYVIGMIYEYKEALINEYLKKLKWPLLTVSVFIVIVFYKNLNYVYIQEIAYMIIILLFFSSFRVSNIFLSYTGTISMEMYLIHGLVIKIVRRFIYFDSPFIMVFITIIGIYISSISLLYLLKWLDSFLFKKQV